MGKWWLVALVSVLVVVLTSLPLVLAPLAGKRAIKRMEEQEATSLANPTLIVDIDGVKVYHVIHYTGGYNSVYIAIKGDSVSISTK